MKRKFKNWVKYLFWCGLICTGISACSDDVLEGEGKKEQKESSPAYLTLAFTTNGNAESRGSTAEGGYNNGDGDGNAEDSNHYTEGLEAEYKVNTVLVIAAPQDDVNVGFAKLYAATPSVTPGESDVVVNQTNKKVFYVDDKTVTASEEAANSPIQLAVGHYKILVVVNPPEDLYGKGFTSTTNLQAIQDLYAKVEDEAYKPSAEIYQGYLNGNLREGGAMMANKVLDENGPANVELTAANTPENPKRATVEVERAISKITYRDLSENNDFKYPITIETDVEASKMIAVVADDEGELTATDNQKFKELELYLAKDLDGLQVGILYTVDENNETSMTPYLVTDDTRTFNEGTYHVCQELTFAADAGEGKCHVTDPLDPKGSLQFIYDDADGERNTYYVTIKGYALVNVAKSVNYVRHTVADSNLDGTPWGSVADKYLWTPGWKEKNAETYADGFGDEYFYNTLAKVSDESKTMTIDEGKFMNGAVTATYFKPMSNLISDSSTDVEGEAHDKYKTEGTDYTETGLTMGYCLENSVDIDHQVNGLVTGISFVATVEDENGEEIQLYRYNGYTYVSLEHIQNAYGKTHFALETEAEDAKGSTFDALVKDSDNASKEKLKENWNIVKYQNNVCYYYTTEIKHFDNGNPNPGKMEFAIMRNNIYSMAIKGIRSVGDPYIDPTPDIPAESGKAALDVEVKIVPWIVRFNDIEF